MESALCQEGSSSMLTPLLSTNCSHVHSIEEEENAEATSEGVDLIPSAELVFNDVTTFHHGMPTHLIHYLNNRRYDYHHAFSADGSRLLTYDHEHFRVWDTIRFTELGRLDVYDEMFYLYNADVCFIDRSSDKFIAFYADGPFLMAQITERPNSQGLVDMRVTTMANAKLILNENLEIKGRGNIKYLCCNGSFAAFEHREVGERERLTLCLLHYAFGDLQWTYIPLEDACQSGEDHSTYLSNDSLLRIETLLSDGQLTNRVRVWPKMDCCTNGDLRSATLEGVDGRFSCNGDVVVTWSAVQNPGQADTVLIYTTTEIAIRCRWSKDGATQSPDRLYKLDEGLTLYYAQLIPSPYHPKDAQSDGEGTHLVLLCDTSWSCTSKIFLIDSQQKTYDMEIDTESHYSDWIKVEPGQTRRWFHRNGPFIVSDDGRWLFYGRPRTTTGTLFSLKNRMALCDVQQHREHNPVEPFFRFDPTGQLISAQLEGGLAISAPPALTLCPLSATWPVNMSDRTMLVMEFIRLYDKSLFERFMANDLAECDLLQSNLLRWLMEDGTLSHFTNSIQEMGEERIKHICFAVDGTVVAFVFQGSPVAVKFWQMSQINHYKSLEQCPCLHTWYGNGVLNDNDKSSLALCHVRADGQQDFVLIHNDRHEVHLTWLDLSTFDSIATKRIWLKRLDSLQRICVQGSKVFVIVSGGRVHELDLDARDFCQTHFLDERKYPFSIRQASMDWNFLHKISAEGAQKDAIVFGWDCSKNKLIATTDCKATPVRFTRAHRSHGSLNVGHVLWMNASRALVHCKEENGSFRLVLYDISGEAATKILTVQGSNIPKFASKFSDLGATDVQEFVTPETADELRAFAACFLLAWRKLLPNERHFHFLGIDPHERHLKRLLHGFGRNVLNAQSKLQLKTLVHHGIIREKAILTRGLYSFAEDNKYQVGATWEESDLLKWAMDEKCLSCMTIAFGKLLSPCTSFTEAAHLFKIHLHDLFKESPYFLKRALLENSLCQPFGKFSVPVGLFEESKTGVIVQSCSNAFSPTSNRQGAKWYWKRVSQAFEWAFEHARGTRILAESKVVMIEDVAQVGMRGILRPMLMNRVPVELFASDLVKWTIQFKWENFWRAKFLKDVAKYLVLLACFSLYAVLIGDHVTTGKSYGWTDGLTDLCLFIVSSISFFDIAGEHRQMTRYRQDRRSGLSYYFSHPWNWIELVSGVLLILVIPLLHILASVEVIPVTPLYGAAALECILLWFKVLYYAQPFSSTGSLVTMIQKIIIDIVFFLFLAFVVMTGFSFAFYLIFQSCDHRIDGFSSLPRSFETLFYAILGDFDLEDYHFHESGGGLSWLSTFLFSLYMMIETVILLNLLIAIMSDTYDRVKLTEEAEIMKCRALVIDDCEAALTDTEIAEVQAQIGKYLHVLMPASWNAGKSPEEAVWQGRVHALELRIKNAMSENEARLQESIENATEERAAMKNQLNQLTDETLDIKQNVKHAIADQSTGIQQQMTHLQSMLDQISNKLGAGSTSSFQ